MGVGTKPALEDVYPSLDASQPVEVNVRKASPRWLLPVTVLLSFLGVAGLVFGWMASRRAKDSREEMSDKYISLRQSIARDFQLLEERLSQTEESNVKLQRELMAKRRAMLDGSQRAGEKTAHTSKSNEPVTATKPQYPMKIGPPRVSNRAEGDNLGQTDPNGLVPGGLSPSVTPLLATQTTDISGLVPKSVADSPAVVQRGSGVAGEVLQPAQLAHRVEPIYPPLARTNHLEGTVKLHAIIGPDGQVKTLDLVSGHPILAAAAMDAVRQWKYRPSLLRGQPVETESYIDVTFRRAGGGSGGQSESVTFAPAGLSPSVPGGSDTGGKILEPAELVRRVEPVYPPLARTSHLQGAVKLHAIIGRDGQVKTLQAVSGDRILAGAALDAVKKWRYRPALLHGEPVESESDIVVVFRRQ